MRIETSSRSYPRFIRLSIITFSILGLMVLATHLWFVHNAKYLLKDMIATKSHGKLKLELSEFSYNFFQNKIQVKKASLISTDTLSAPVTYSINFKKLTLKSSSFFSALFGKKITFDSIKLHEPDIVITQWRKDTVTRKTDDLSIPQEMGRLYNSMLDGLDAFAIRRIWIRDAKLTLVNKLKPLEKPVTVSNIQFNLFRTAEGLKKRDEFIHGAHTVDLDIDNQDIQLPGGRHRLSFKKFKLELFRKRIELDSCTVTANISDTSRSNYKVFFKKLLLVGADFDKMYRNNLIKADSVYCEDPLFLINLNTANARKNNSGRPDPEKIIQELTGDLELAFVGVKNAGIHININGKRKRSLFNSHQDDFEMHGLRINADSSKPVVVDRFDMLVRDYHLYDKDSSSKYSFDSIHFLNNTIVLNNFSVETDNTRGRRASVRNFRIPRFELTGIDWHELIFEETIRAQEAVLINPVIQYASNPTAKSKKRQNFFQTLQSLDDLVTLNKITVVNGQISMLTGKSTSVNIADANIVLYSNRLLGSTDKEGLRKSIERLSFSRSTIRLNDLDAELVNAKYTGTNLLHADMIRIAKRNKSISATLNNVDIANLVIDDDKKDVLLDGLRWQNAKVTINTDQKQNPASSNIHLKNLSGKNTSFSFTNGKTSVSTFISSLTVNDLSKGKNSGVNLHGLEITGTALNFKTPELKLKADSYQISDENTSFLTNVDFNQVKNRDTIILKAPKINFFADINAAIENDIHFESLALTNPFLRINKWSSKTDQTSPTNLRIDYLAASEPDFEVGIHKNDSVSYFKMLPSPGSSLKLKGISINEDGVLLNNLSLNSRSATFTKTNGEIIGVKDGNIDLDISNISFSSKNGKPEWSAWIKALHMESPEEFSLGPNRNKLKVGNTSIGNVNLSSAYINNFSKLIKLNLSAWMRSSTGEYADSSVKFKWYNAEYNADKKLLALDSFRYTPARSLDTVMSQSAYQTDYITVSTGKIELSDFDVDRFEKDSALLAKSMHIYDPVITIYRDKKPPFLSGVIKPLPVDMIARIGLPVEVDRLQMHDGWLSYTERNAKTRAEGTVTLTHMNAILTNIKNRHIKTDDSLYLRMNAYLMDSTFLNLVVKESYSDSLNGFLMTLKMRPTSLSFLNPVLVPLSNVKITSGTIDSFEVRAIGKEDLAIGEMRMFYHDLHIRLVKNGEEARSGVGNRIATFLANLIIRKNNHGKVGIIYFKRLKDRSFFNYIVKMTFSGMATSIGVKKNRKYMKNYRRELKKRNLPPVELR